MELVKGSTSVNSLHLKKPYWVLESSGKGCFLLHCSSLGMAGTCFHVIISDRNDEDKPEHNAATLALVR